MTDAIDIGGILSGDVRVDIGRQAVDEYHWISNQAYRGEDVRRSIHEAMVKLIEDPNARVREGALRWFRSNRFPPAGPALLNAWMDSRSLYEGVPQHWERIDGDLLGLLRAAVDKNAARGRHAIAEAEEARAAERKQAMLDAAPSTTPEAVEAEVVPAAQAGDAETVARLAPLCALGTRSFLLQQAAKAGHLDVMRALIAVGVRQVDLDRSLSGAAYDGDTVRGALLLQAGARLGHEGAGGARLPIHAAAQQGQTAMVRWLVEQGADVDAPDGDRYTALLVAVDHGRVDTVSALVELGADPLFRASDGQTPRSAAKQHADKKALLAAMKSP